MGIETLLTLLVAAGILLAAAAMRLLVLGLVRAVTLFTGDGVLSPTRGHHSIDAALPRVSLRARARNGLESTRAASLFLAAAVYSGIRKGIQTFHRASLWMDAHVMQWWAVTGLPFLKESASATYDLATFYRARPEEMPYLAESALVPTFDPTEDTPRWAA